MFDPYHKWLGILSNDQSLNHYRLLGLEPFESDLDVIDGAADKQMNCVRQYQSGEHAADAARLLNELAVARLCLLKPKAKGAYDAKLRREMEPVKSGESEFPVATGLSPKRRARRGAKRSSNPQSAKRRRPLMIGGAITVIVIAIAAALFVNGRTGQPLDKTPDTLVAAIDSPAGSSVARLSPDAELKPDDSMQADPAAFQEGELSGTVAIDTDSTDVTPSSSLSNAQEPTPAPANPSSGESAAAPGSIRSQLPSPQRLTQIRTLLDETYELSKATSTARKQQALKALMEVAADTATPNDQRYVVLEIVLPLLIDANDFTRLRKVIDQLTENFDVDVQSERIKHVSAFMAACKSKTAFDRVSGEILLMAKSAAEGNRYEEARGLLAAMDKAAKRLQATRATTESLADARKVVDEREIEFKRQLAAYKTLAANSDDPDANSIVGRWLAIYEENWTNALKHLTDSGNASWVAAAAEELKNPEDVDGRLAVADKWWNVADASADLTRFVVQVHANDWYSLVARDVKNPIQKAHVAKRQTLLAKEIAAGELRFGKRRPAMTTPSPTPAGIAEDTASAGTGPWVDLMEWAEGVDWARRGIDWNTRLEGPPTKTGLALKPTRLNYYPLPAIIDGDYELEAEFTRYEGVEGVSIFFPIGNHTMHLELGANMGAFGGVTWIDGKHALDPNSGNPTTKRPSPLSNNQPHRVNLRVRRDGDKAAFTIDLDDAKGYIAWEGPYSSLWNLDTGQWRLHMTRHVWLGNNHTNRVTFNKIRVRMTAGVIKRDVITEADRKLDFANGFVRLVGEKASSPIVGWGSFLVNQYPTETPGAEITERAWPLISRNFRFCDDFYGAHAPSRLTCPLPRGAKSFSAVAYNDSSRTTRFKILADGKEIYESGVADIVLIKVDLPPRTSTLDLVVENVGEETFDRSYWCYPRYHNVPADKITDKMIDGEQRTTAFVITSSNVRFGTSRHNVVDFSTSAPVYFRDAVPCDEFLFAHAPSSVTYEVPEGMNRFTAIAYNIRSHQAKYEVWADGKRIYESSAVGIVPIDVPLPIHTKVLELKIGDLGHFASDYSMWCYPRLHRK